MIIHFSDNWQPDLYPNSGTNQFVAYPLSEGMTDSAYVARVKAAMKARRVTQEQISKHLGLTSQSAFSNILNGKRGLKAHEKAAIDSYLGIDDGSNVMTLPIIGLTGAGNWAEAIEMPIGHISLIKGVAGNRSFAVEVCGDSMDQLIENGGFVVVDPDKTNLFDGSVYLIGNGDEETMVKRYRSNPARFCPMSSNPEHVDLIVGERHFRVIGKVVWKGGMVA